MLIFHHGFFSVHPKNLHHHWRSITNQLEILFAESIMATVYRCIPQKPINTANQVKTQAINQVNPSYKPSEPSNNML